jgi:hypothetical protein
VSVEQINYGILQNQQQDLRHDAGHANKRIDSSKADRDAPETSGSYDALTQSLVTCDKAENGARAIGNSLMNVTVWMVLKARIVHLEPRPLQERGYLHCCGLLSVHTDSKGLDASKKEE